jgi:hypothetical protein
MDAAAQKIQASVPRPDGILADPRTPGAASKFKPETATWIRGGALLILLAEFGYLIDALAGPPVVPLVLALHILNLVPAVAALTAGSTRWFERNWRGFIWSTSALLIASTTIISLKTGQTGLLFGTLVLSLLGSAALAPWSFGWQASLEIVALVCVAPTGLFGLYQWQALILAIFLAHGALKLNWLSRQKSTETEARLREKVVELEQSERRAHANAETVLKILEASPDRVAITRYSDATYIRIWNNAFEVSGYDHEALVGKSSYRAGVWASKDEYKRYLRQLANEGCVRSMEVMFHRPDGTEFRA